MDDIKQPQPQQPAQAPMMDVQPPQVTQNEQPAPTPAPEEPEVPAQSSEVPASASETQLESTPVLAAVASAHKTRRAPLVAIVCAVVFTGVFAAVAVMAYMSKSDVKQTTDTTQQSTSTGTEESPATATDVTDTDKAIDDNMSSVDDAADYNDAGVSDTTLGL